MYSYIRTEFYVCAEAELTSNPLVIWPTFFFYFNVINSILPHQFILYCIIYDVVLNQFVCVCSPNTEHIEHTAQTTKSPWGDIQNTKFNEFIFKQIVILFLVYDRAFDLVCPNPRHSQPSPQPFRGLPFHVVFAGRRAHSFVCS